MTHEQRDPSCSSKAWICRLSRVGADLLERSGRLSPYEEVHFEGHVLTSEQLVAGLRAALGDPRRKVRRFPWWVLGLAAPFSATVRAVRALRYLWHRPVRLDNAKLRRLLGEEEPRTELVVALRQTLAATGNHAALATGARDETELVTDPRRV